jgi:hypothetical protein
MVGFEWPHDHSGAGGYHETTDQFDHDSMGAEVAEIGEDHRAERAEERRTLRERAD